MNCTHFEKLSMLYFDGDTSEQLVAQLKEHMDNCSSCKKSFESMKQTLELLETQDEFEIDEKFTMDVMSGINEYEESKVRTAMFIEKIALPLTAVILGIGGLTWYIILNNIRIGFVLYRLVNLVVLLIDTAVSIILYSRVNDYIRFINSQLQVILPFTIILIGIMVSAGNYYKKDQENT